MKRTLPLLTALWWSLWAAQAQKTTTPFQVRSETRYVSWQPSVPKPERPASLVIDNLHFADQNGNRRIDAQETFTVSYTLHNQGRGDAYQIKPSVEFSAQPQHLSIQAPKPIALLRAGDSIRIVQRGSATQELRDGTLTITLAAQEGNGFNPPSRSITVETYAFRPPQVWVAQTRFSTRNGGVPKSGEVITLQLLVENRGESTANDVRVHFQLPPDIFAGDTVDFSVGRLQPGEQQILEFPFFTNQRYTASQVPITVTLHESYGLYAQGTTATVDLARSLAKSTPMVITGAAKTQIQMGTKSLYSDVDMGIPATKNRQPHIFALVIGNEHYQAYNREVDVPYAGADAAIFKEYLVRTIGIPESNVILIQDATKAAFEQAVERVAQLAATYPERDKHPTGIIFYYAGHGLCDARRNGYLMPVDVPGTQVQQGIRSSDVYHRLALSGAERVTVFLDACFSGGARGEQLLAARAVKIEPNRDVIAGNTVIFAATQSNQAAHAYNDKQHGMFTYFLLRKLKETHGTGTYGELTRYLKNEVTHNALRVNQAEQNPDVLVSPAVQSEWTQWQLTR